MKKKYIIELEDKPFHKEDGDFLYRVKGFNSLVFDVTGVGKLTPYTEPDLEQVRKEAYEAGAKSSAVVIADDKAHEAYKLGYENGLNDLWEAMQKAIKMYCEIDNEVFLRVFHDVKCDWGESVLQALFKNTPQHVIDSIRKYEQKKQESITAEDVMRQYLDTFCEGQSSCEKCPLNTEEFTCGRGFGFINHNIRERVTDEEVRRAYSTVLAKMKEWQDE